MKTKYFFLAAMISFVFASCSAQKELLIQKINGMDHNPIIEDTVLRNLREKNDLVIAYATENFAWTRSINYLILTQTNGEWMGYQYYVNLMRNSPQASVPGNINPAIVNKASCDSLLQYITQHLAWNIKGDGGQNFCPDGNNGCNINDASGARLWIITKKGLANPSYYAPEFFEQCCPDKDRALFLSIINKIQNIVAVQAISR
jgi:hypothetical protein